MRLFILAAGPLPNEKGIRMQTAYGLRTWQFLSGIKDLNVETKVVLLSKDEHYKKGFKDTQNIIHLDKDSKAFLKKLKKIYKDFKPDACLGINNLPCYYLAKLKPKAPFWADLNGWVMAEAQSEAHLLKDDAYLGVLWERERLILQSADQISTVSERQKSATYGELASLGRLNQYTDEYEFVHAIPNANELQQKPSNYALRKNLQLKKEDFILLFSGSYNTWLDEETLFKGVESAIKKNKKIHYVSTGNPSKSFESKVKNSTLKKHFHFLGWLEKEDLIACYKEANLALNIDRPNTETYFGARNRINEWIQYGVPVLSTLGTEISGELSEAKAILSVPTKDPKALARSILEASKSKELDKIAKRAALYAKTHYSVKATTKALQEWLVNPNFSPDRSKFSIPKNSLTKRATFKVKKDGLGFLVKWLIKKIR